MCARIVKNIPKTLFEFRPFVKSKTLNHAVTFEFPLSCRWFYLHFFFTWWVEIKRKMRVNNHDLLCTLLGCLYTTVDLPGLYNEKHNLPCVTALACHREQNTVRQQAWLSLQYKGFTHTLSHLSSCRKKWHPDSANTTMSWRPVERMKSRGTYLGDICALSEYVSPLLNSNNDKNKHMKSLSRLLRWEVCCMLPSS